MQRIPSLIDLVIGFRCLGKLVDGLRKYQHLAGLILAAANSQIGLLMDRANLRLHAAKIKFGLLDMQFRNLGPKRRIRRLLR